MAVHQVQPTSVSSGSETFDLGKVLPGQRDRSQFWQESIKGFLREQLNFKHCDAYPSLLGNEERLILLHVDDMLPGDLFEFLKRIHRGLTNFVVAGAGAGGRWPLASEGVAAAGGRWLVAGGRWRCGDRWWSVARGR